MRPLSKGGSQGCLMPIDLKPARHEAVQGSHENNSSSCRCAGLHRRRDDIYRTESGLGAGRGGSRRFAPAACRLRGAPLGAARPGTDWIAGHN